MSTAVRTDYAAFLAAKRAVVQPCGVDVEPSDLHPALFGFQRDLTAWALRKGRAAVFADTGLGKTAMQIEWARPIWYGIKETDTLNVAPAREKDDERHICPLQLGTIERCVRLWSNRGETVLSPFAGIGSEGFMALKLGRSFVGVELKRSYWEIARRNLEAAANVGQLELPLGVSR